MAIKQTTVGDMTIKLTQVKGGYVVSMFDQDGCLCSGTKTLNLEFAEKDFDSFVKHEQEQYAMGEFAAV